MDKNFQQQLLEEVLLLLTPLKCAAEDEQAREQFFKAIGWQMESVSGVSEAQLMITLGNLADAIDDIVQMIQDPPETIPEVLSALDVVKTIIDSVQQIKDLADSGAPPQFDEIVADIINFLVSIYVERRSPVMFRILSLLTVIEPRESNSTAPLIVQGNQLIRYPSNIPTTNLSRLIDLVSSPINTLKDYYIPSGALITVNDANYTADLLFPRIAALLNVLGFHVVYGLPSYAQSLYTTAGYEIGRHTLSAHFDLPDSPFSFGFSFSLSSLAQGNLGLVIAPYGAVDISHQLGNWQLDASISAGLEGFAIGPEGLTLPDTFVGTDVNASLKLIKLDNDGSAFMIGSTTGTHLKIGGFNVEGILNYNPGLEEYKLQLDIQNGALVISGSDGDGFLSKILPQGGTQIDFNLLFGWSNLTGFYFEGSAGLELLIPVHKTVLEVLRIDSVLVGIKANNSNLGLFAAIDAGLEIGPFTATIERMGLKADIEFPSSGGNLGLMDVDFNFLPPKGIGFSVDTSVFRGGGFLSFDYENERYVGALELTVKDKISLKVIGILTTKLPGNDDGYSLLLLITAEFQPINLGFGFTLNGVGGLIALNRTMNLNYLRDGVRSNTLDNILFPTDPIANINQIISDLEGAFPVQEGRYAFGPMAIIGWGTPTLITIELGLMLEVPNPIRLAILGVLRAILPTENKQLLKLQVNFIGTIDFEAKFITFDASIFESKLLSFTLEGDMAFRLKYGGNNNFLFSVGGFHPSYTPPPLQLPALRRLTINLLGGDNPRLTLTSYFAVTSNSVQFGAAVDFYYKITGKWSVVGYLGFDILIQFNPFYLSAQIAASLALMRNGDSVMGIYLGGSVSGPAPWHVQGKAEVKICGIKLKANFDKTFGQPETTTLPNIDVLPKLTEALQNKANWEANTPASSHMLVSMRERDNDPQNVVIHPFGTLGVSQKVVPLRMTINKFGTQRPADYQTFDLEIANSAGVNFPSTVLKDFFAPAEYLALSDSAKLSRKSFEEFDSGIGIKGGDEVKSSYLMERTLAYEMVVFDKRSSPIRPGIMNESAQAFRAFTQNGAAAKSPLGTNRKPVSQNAPAKVSVAQEKFVIAKTENLSLYNSGLEAVSEAEARVLLDQLLTANPALTDQIQVVPQYQVA